uniref:40S ribosomal protein S27-like n=1 Tax=Marmota marmota marmota TaxID=9994 RepID=A0A8C5ZFB9_MARMA
MPLEKDLLHPSPEEKRKYKKKSLVQSPNSYFMDVKCPGCYKITTVFSDAKTVVLCICCFTQDLQEDAPSGGSSTKKNLNQDDIFRYFTFILFSCQCTFIYMWS